ncbi:MAG: FeoA family protein [Bacillota bacterium]|nr:FeoA family protein [Bacillota bacterium]
MNYTEIPLNKLQIGKKANVTFIAADSPSERRIQDLGVISGTEIRPLYKSPSGNPGAYLIRGAVIALRDDISSRIMVKVI